MGCISMGVCVLIVVLALPLCFGLLQNQLINGHDATSNLMMALCMDKYAGDGQFLIRWASELNFGYGYPMFNFYPPAYFVLTFFVSKIIHDVTLTMNLIAVFFWILSGVGMYYWSKEFWGWRGALLSAVAYMYAPYHIQDIYVRSAFSEFSAFAFFPLILLSFYKINQRAHRGYVLLGVFSVFALGCGHLMMLILFMPVAIFYLLFLYFEKKDFQGLGLSFLVLGAGLMTSAFFWLPVFWEKQFLNTVFLIPSHVDFHHYFVSWQQLLHLPWGNTADFDGISFQIGLVYLVLALVPLVFLRKKNLHYFFFLGVAAVAVFLLLPLSSFFWGSSSPLKFVQFPWRFLTIVSFAVSFLAGSLMLMFKGKSANFVLPIVLVLIICTSIKFFRPVHYLNVDQVAVKNDLSSIFYLGEGRTTPKWVLVPPLKPPLHKFEFVHGNGEIEGDRVISSIEHIAQIHAQVQSLVCFHSFYFPGWRVFVDGKETQIYPNNPYGVILFPVLPGEHSVRVVFGSTPVRSIAGVASWAGLIPLGMAIWLI